MLLLLITLVIGFVAGVVTTAYLAVSKAETHDFILQDGRPRWVERK